MLEQPTFDFTSSVGDGLKVYEDRIVISHSGVLNAISMGVHGDNRLCADLDKMTVQIRFSGRGKRIVLISAVKVHNRFAPVAACITDCVGNTGKIIPGCTGISIGRTAEFVLTYGDNGGTDSILFQYCRLISLCQITACTNADKSHGRCVKS